MMNLIINVFIISILLVAVDCHFFSYLYPRIKLEARADKVAGEPFIVTPYLRNGSIYLAQNLSRVLLTDLMYIKSYAGFFTVNEKFNSNLYFWYFPPESGNLQAPVILWLQGGPGASSLFGLFTEIGPLSADVKGFSRRNYNWAKDYHLLFIDNPVGTGFSFTSNHKGYCTNENCVAKDLYCSIVQFYQLFPYLMYNDFYISGESYAGKYIPNLAMKIHKENMKNNFKINLKGLAMGNAYCDPVNQMDYSSYLYQHGLIDLQQKTIFEIHENKIKEQIRNENWKCANILMDKLMDGDMANSSYFKMYTGYHNYYNFLETESDDSAMIEFANLLQRNDIRRKVHVGSLPFNSGDEVQLLLAYDLLKSVAPLISELLTHYKIMLYSGQLDIIVAYPLTVNFIRNLNFTSANEYMYAARHIWQVDDELAGYVKVAGNLTEVLVRNAGHMVPYDQPKWALDMMTRFVENKCFW